MTPALEGHAPAVLVVEDERIVAYDIAMRLRELGYEVAGVAHSAEGAVRAVTDRCPDLVLMDIRIEGARDGIDAACEIQRSQDVPIVFLTAYADEDTLQRARAALPCGYLMKPFTKSELSATVMMSLTRSAAERAARFRSGRLQAAIDTAHIGLWYSGARAGEAVVIEGGLSEELGLFRDGPLRAFGALLARAHDRDREALRALIAGGKPATGQFEITTPEGTTRWLEFSARWHDDHRASPAVVGVFTDVTEGHRDLEIARQDAFRQGLVGQFGQLVHAGRRPLYELLSEAVARAAIGVDAHECFALEQVPSEGRFLVAARVEPPGRGADAFASAALGALAAQCLESMDVVMRREPLGAGFESAIAVPIRRRKGGPFGVLVALSEQPRDFAPRDGEFLQSVADFASVAVDRSRS